MYTNIANLLTVQVLTKRTEVVIALHTGLHSLKTQPSAILIRLFTQLLHLLIRPLVGKLRLQVLTRAKLLYAKIGGKVLLSYVVVCLLISQSSLQRLLRIHTAGLQLVGYVLNIGLLLVG